MGPPADNQGTPIVSQTSNKKGATRLLHPMVCEARYKNDWVVRKGVSSKGDSNTAANTDFPSK